MSAPRKKHPDVTALVDEFRGHCTRSHSSGSCPALYWALVMHPEAAGAYAPYLDSLHAEGECARLFSQSLQLTWTQRRKLGRLVEIW